MTVVWIVCDNAFLLMPLQEGTHHKLLSGKKSKFCKQGGKLDYSRYSEVSLLTLLLSLANSFLLEKVIAKDPSSLSLCALLCVLSYSSLSFNFMF